MGTVELALIVDGIRCHHLVKPKKERGSGVALVNTVRGVVAPGTVHNRLAAHASARKAVISGSALLSINKSLLARKENGQAGTRQVPGGGRAWVTYRGTQIRARVTRGYCNYLERT